MEKGKKKSWNIIVILGIIFMIVGIEFTAYLILIDLLPS